MVRDERWRTGAIIPRAVDPPVRLQTVERKPEAVNLRRTAIDGQCTVRKGVRGHLSGKEVGCDGSYDLHRSTSRISDCGSCTET